jgi:hypothetical protein
MYQTSFAQEGLHLGSCRQFYWFLVQFCQRVNVLLHFQLFSIASFLFASSWVLKLAIFLADLRHWHDMAGPKICLVHIGSGFSDGLSGSIIFFAAMENHAEISMARLEKGRRKGELTAVLLERACA